MRTPSPKPEVRAERDITTTDKNNKINRNYKRGVRSEIAINRRKTKHLTKQREERREYRKQKSETSRGDWQRLATKARQLAKQPPKKACKDETYNEQQHSPENKTNKTHTRAKLIRNMNNTQHIKDKTQEPEVHKMKWKYAEIMKVGSTNIRGMRDPVKREETILQMERHNIDIMCIQETKIRDSCYEVRKGFTFVFSSVSTIREHWGVGICYRSYMGNYRNYYKQLSSNIMSMEINMHGNPMIIISAYIPHDDSDNNSRDRAWEDLSGFIGEIPEAISVIVLGDLNTNLHTRKADEEDHIGPNIYGKGAQFLRNKELLTPAEKTTNREHLIMLLRANDLKVANTLFQKEDKYKVTYQKKDNTDGGPPWDTERYCELDHCLVRKQWSNSIIDMQADPHTNINTDHEMIAIKVRQKLKAREEPNREPTLRNKTRKRRPAYRRST